MNELIVVLGFLIVCLFGIGLLIHAELMTKRIDAKWAHVNELIRAGMPIEDAIYKAGVAKRESGG